MDTASLDLPDLARTEKINMLAVAVEQAQKGSPTRAAVEYGVLLATPVVLGLQFGWLGAAIGVPLGGIFYLLAVSWNERDARAAAKKLERHLVRRKGRTAAD